MNDDHRSLYIAIMAVVMFYAIHETGRVVFGFHTSGTLANLAIDCCMFYLALGLRSPVPCAYILGHQLNGLVMAMNDGRMPVVGGVPASARHVAANESHRFLWLADRFRFFDGEASVGDILIVVSLGGTLWLVSRRVFARQTT